MSGVASYELHVGQEKENSNGMCSLIINLNEAGCMLSTFRDSNCRLTSKNAASLSDATQVRPIEALA
jgi:hypothetical protein